MKKVLAVLFAVMFAFSVCTVAFAADITISGSEDKNIKCDYCGCEFTSVEMFNDHLNATFPVKNHEVECDTCFDVFTTKAALEAHVCTNSVSCKYKDNGCDWTGEKKDYDTHCEECEYRSFCAMISNGHVIEAFKFAFNKVVEFFKNETVQKVLGTIKDLLGKIDLGSVVSTVKGVVEKIPFDSIVSKVKEVIA